MARVDRWLLAAAGVLLVVLAAVVYLVTQVPDRPYDHFVWQAQAFLEGQAAIRYPVGPSTASHGNAYFQDVLPIVTTDGVARGVMPFPPLPAVLLVPFVAVWGLATDDQTLFTLLAAIDIGICWWMLGRLRLRTSVRMGTTVLFAFGTVFWYSAQLETTWYQAHIVAVGLCLLAVGLALGGDPGAQDDDATEALSGEAPPGEAPPGEAPPGEAPPGKATLGAARPVGAPPGRAPTRLGRLAVDRRQFAAGFLLGLAGTARLTVLLGAPFFLLVGPGGGWWRRGWSAALGASIPIGLLLAYNVATTGHLFHPAYDYLYGLESNGYAALGYHPEWSAEDPRYLPQNARIMLLTPPDILPRRLPDSLGVANNPVCVEPGAVRGLFDPACPLALPSDVGMSVLLTSPAFLLAIPALRRFRRNRLVTGGALAVLAIVVVDLMHFSQGWVQFGYRFSNDAVPFILPLIAIGFERSTTGSRAMALAVALIAASVAINAWGVAWGRLLGW